MLTGRQCSADREDVGFGKECLIETCRNAHSKRPCACYIGYSVHGGVYFPLFLCLSDLHAPDRCEAMDVDRQSRVKKNELPGRAQAPSTEAGAAGPRKRGGPDSNLGVAPAQVRSGQVRQWSSPSRPSKLATETALKSEMACRELFPLVFLLHRPSARRWHPIRAPPLAHSPPF